jgi:hypothetical protein
MCAHGALGFWLSRQEANMPSPKRAQIIARAENAERRESSRYQANEAATLWYRGKSFACTVLNVSAGGALVESSFVPSVGAAVDLDVVKWGQFPAKVVHVTGDHLGLMFLSDEQAKTSMDAKKL